MDSVQASGGYCVLGSRQVVCFVDHLVLDATLYPLHMRWEMAADQGRLMTIGDVIIVQDTEENWGPTPDGGQQTGGTGPKVRCQNADKYGPDIERHEAVHADQWARYVNWTGFVTDYAAASAVSVAVTTRYEWGSPGGGGKPAQPPRVIVGNPIDGNIFEIQANLYWGGYKKPPQPPSGSPTGPVPQPSPLGWS
ncbi:hypothetical protein [Dactylosporangium salmoneum]|uniref:Uncharacterized protein n=1 Tax=Dactylosporangium salmoneum TaxID=53361 RepID=A0ABP5V511_9ACTN